MISSKSRRGIVIITPSNLASGRREFLQGLLPAGALVFSCCGLLSASAEIQDKPAKNKSLEGSDLTMRDAFWFAYLWT
jgi:hypothetical protein